MVIAPRPPTANETIDILTSTLADAVLVDQVRLDSSDLSGATGPASMDVPVAAGPQPRLLTFHPRLGQDGALQARADDYVITLWQIQAPDTASAKLHAVRIYHVIDASHGVYIEGTLLQPGHLRVLDHRAHRISERGDGRLQGRDVPARREHRVLAPVPSAIATSRYRTHRPERRTRRTGHAVRRRANSRACARHAP